MRLSIVCLVLLAPAAARAAEPTIRNLDLRGLQVGATTTITIDGDELGPAPRLLLPFAAQPTLKPGNTPQRASFDVALAADVTPGYYNLRVVTEGGVSLPVIMWIGGVGFWPALGVDIGLTLLYTGYAYVFHLAYDWLRPVVRRPEAVWRRTP